TSTAAELARLRTDTLQAERAQRIPVAPEDTFTYGTPTFWKAAADAAIPELEFISLWEEEQRQALAGTGLVIVLFLIAAMLSFFPRLVAWITVFWPEQMAALGCAGWIWLDRNPIFALVVFLAIVIRFGYLISWAISWKHRPAPVTTAPAGGIT